MKCEYCDVLERNENIIYQDNDVVVAIKEYGLVEGQATIFPRKHLTILEMANDAILEKCSVIANKVGIAVFDSLGVQGTNLIINNGLGAGQKIPHFSLDLIPRQRDDNLPLFWQPQTSNDEEIGTTFSLLREELVSLQHLQEKNKDEEKSLTTAESKAKQHTEGKEDLDSKDNVDSKDNGKSNYMIKSLRRIP